MIRRALACGLLIVTATALASAVPGSVRLADASDQAAFRSWFVLIADAQFERTAPDVTDCAALVRFAVREALRSHTTEWARRMALPFTPTFPDVISGPRPTSSGWALFQTARAPKAQYGEFADARTLVTLNARPLGRQVAALQPGDLLYFRQPSQAQPDHLMIFVGKSVFDEGRDWIVYHTGPLDDGPGEVRKVRLRDLARHPAPRWRPLDANPRFVGVFRLLLL